eukprot:scaffold27_cov355-Prasinococcus_capsulatus_cf.AAC.15
MCLSAARVCRESGSSTQRQAAHACVSCSSHRGGATDVEAAGDAGLPMRELPDTTMVMRCLRRCTSDRAPPCRPQRSSRRLMDSTCHSAGSTFPASPPSCTSLMDSSCGRGRAGHSLSARESSAHRARRRVRALVCDSCACCTAGHRAASRSVTACSCCSASSCCLALAAAAASSSSCLALALLEPARATPRGRHGADRGRRRRSTPRPAYTRGAHLLCGAPSPPAPASSGASAAWTSRPRTARKRGSASGREQRRDGATERRAAASAPRGRPPLPPPPPPPPASATACRPGSPPHSCACAPARTPAPSCPRRS